MWTGQQNENLTRNAATVDGLQMTSWVAHASSRLTPVIQPVARHTAGTSSPVRRLAVGVWPTVTGRAERPSKLAVRQRSIGLVINRPRLVPPPRRGGGATAVHRTHGVCISCST